MPELPEVETIRRGVDANFRGAEIAEADVLHQRAVRRQAEGGEFFAQSLAGARITGSSRRGKYMWLTLDSGQALLCHLGMSGQFHAVTEKIPAHRHLRIALRFTDGRELWFVDQRTFGGMEVTEMADGLPERISHIAPDVFDPAYDADRAVERLRAKRSEVKRVLLDQGWVSGIGNIYADEALWRAGLSPVRSGHRVGTAKAADLLSHVTDVLTEAVTAGGTSFDELYVNVNGESGYFDRSLNAYGRAGQPCRRCETVMRKRVVGGRATHHCPHCQR
ncbi:bifunctional DNA-formamidopyrimidine glycosylase/DNA-(apurinic or apyrimidinic site) lyase [Salininema proteolyticum]|uniref:Formamidopyrimidine-DNA glycosylase n=1 Tax=Salininema proteolyticum TaxID=1607685 RepID=A0ABV8U2F5_9ACTN